MSKKYDDRPLPEIASDMLEWCISQGCEKLGETAKEYRVQCPNDSCPSRQKSEAHKAFDINKHDANYNCKHCGLQGTGLHGNRGLIAMLESGDFFPSASSRVSKINPDTEYFKPKKRIDIKPCIDRQQYSNLFRKYGLKSENAQAYLKKRGVLSEIESDTEYYHICAVPKETKIPFLDEPLNGEIIIFPNRKPINNTLEVIHLQYRYIVGDKWYNPKDVPKRIWWTKQHNNIIVITEGIPDALSAAVAGFTGCALLGTEITADYDLEPFRDKSVVILLDNDKTGQDAVEKIASQLINNASEVRIATIPQEIDGQQVKDPNDILVKCGAEKLKEIIESAKLYDVETEQFCADPTTISNDATTTDEQQAKSSAETAQSQESPSETKGVETPKVKVTEDKPKKETGIVFPKEAWRGIFQTYREAVQGTTEAPEQYHFGVLATIVGIIIGRACYLYHAGELYPNFYTAIVGPSGKSRKTTATNLCMRILGDVDPNVIVLRGLSSPEGLIEILQIPTDEELEDLPEHARQRAASVMPVASYEGYRCLVFCNEFASLLKKAKNESTSGIIQALTDLYDCPLTLDNPTRNRPLRAERPTGAMIALSTTEWLERNLTPEDVFGGFGNRFCFYNYTSTEPIPRPQKPDGALIDAIIGKLTNIRQKRKERQTEYYFDSDAEKVVDEWYLDRWYRAYDSDVVAVISERIDVHVRKIALLYAILENAPDDYAIHTDQIEAAIKIGSYYEQSALSIFGTFGFTQTTRSEMRVIETLADNPMTKTDIHQKLSGRLSATELERIIASLLNVGRIEKRRESYTDSMNRKRYRELYAKVER